MEPHEFGLFDTYGKSIACHIQDSPERSGKSGQHDTNIDTDHGGNGAIVVPLMPFGDTPNPGGVYKAWAEKFDTYKTKGGNLDYQPMAIKGVGAKDCPRLLRGA